MMTETSDPSCEDQLQVAQCSICLGDIDDPVNLCVDDHESCCRDCARGYITAQISDAYFGTCPCICCPSLTHQKAKKKKMILFNRWSGVVPTETSTKYKQLASHLLAFLCGGCHTLKSLDVGFEPDYNSKVEKLLTDAEGSNAKYSAFCSDMSKFSLGDIDLEEFYAAVCKYFPQLSILEDLAAWEFFLPLLKTIQEPERRCNLHLRYLRDHPRMKTLCCSREHCFRCKIKDFHNGMSCVEYSSNLDNTIVTCPSCGIALARGDGCNTITCVCSKQFSWSTEKENTDRSFAFRQRYPEDTSLSCANVLCTLATPASASDALILQAKAWQIRNRVEVNRALRAHFKKTFSPCPSQMCARLIPERQPDGIREAMTIWKTMHEKEVTHCQTQNAIALASLFTTTYPIVSERPVAAHLLVSLSAALPNYQHIDPRLAASASKWIETHRAEYAEGVSQWELRSAQQFLYLYGRHKLHSLKPAHQNVYCVQSFNRDISNNDLVFSNQDTSAMRPGSASCYPAAFADLTGERCMFRVRIDEAPRSSNWLTFGVARRLGMANSSSDGVGRSPNSWGLSDDRSSSSAQSTLCACGTEATQFRKLMAGDVLTAMIDTHEGWLDIMLNESEATHRFTIPAGSAQEYMFAMTFANDHRVTIIADSSFTMMPISSAPTSGAANVTTSSTATTADPSTVYLNYDHTCMLANFKKQLRLILSETDENSFVTAPNSAMITDGSKWLQFCDGSHTLARNRIEAVLPIVENILHIRSKGAVAASKLAESSDPQNDNNKSNGERLFPHLSTVLLLDALSWYRLNRDRIYQDRKGELAMNFSLIHGDSAPFIAAMTASQSQQSASSVAADELQAAIAYMHFFAEEMQEWYSLDAVSGDPLVDHVARGCQCLPRHLRTCPMANK